jgi:hypothetical protein
MTFLFYKVVCCLFFFVLLLLLCVILTIFDIDFCRVGFLGTKVFSISINKIFLKE